MRGLLLVARLQVEAESGELVVAAASDGPKVEIADVSGVGDGIGRQMRRVAVFPVPAHFLELAADTVLVEARFELAVLIGDEIEDAGAVGGEALVDEYDAPLGMPPELQLAVGEKEALLKELLVQLAMDRS